MINPMIEFCQSNYAHGTEMIKEQLEQNPDYDVMEYGCLGHCSQCIRTPFALVEGEYVEATTPEELQGKIEEKIKEQRALSDLFDKIIEDSEKE